MKIELDIRDERLRGIVESGVDLQRLGTGYAFTEGPVWHPKDRHLIFSDMPGDHMRRWTESGGVTTFRRPASMANGNAYDRRGRLITCEHATSRVTRTEPDGSITTLASHHNGRELNSPNDVVVKSDGAVYFTDPIYGRIEYYGVKREPQLDFRGVYRVEADGTCRLLADDFGQPNGLCFSLDEKTLFVNDTERNHIRVFEVAGDGSLSGGRVWAETTGEGKGAPDGMKIDSAGNLYCCGPGGIHVFDRHAACLGVIRMPEVQANFCWGGGDLKDFFVTASSSLYRLRVKVPGLPAF
jgi:gluconolactonase